MIKRPGILLLILFSLLISACNTGKNREIFEDFEGEDGVYMIKLPPALFLAMLDSDSALNEAEVGNIDFVKLLVFDESKALDKTSGEIVSEIRNKFDKYGYEMAIQFSSSGNDISVYLLDNEEYVSDIMIVIKGGDGMMGLGLSGKLDGRALMSFASEVDYNDLKDIIDIEGFGI